jgi:hypothetical protein
MMMHHILALETVAAAHELPELPQAEHAETYAHQLQRLGSIVLVHDATY